MAGAGYKLFNTGDVLTAAQVNTYLQEQTVMVFASSTARTTALSGVLAEGMMSYLQDTNAVEVYNGTSWVNVGNAGDITEVQAGVGISIASGTGPIPVITNSSTDLITTAGDLLYGTAADTVARLGIGTAGQVLTVNSGATAPEWKTAGGGGKVLQVVYGNYSTSTLIASTTFTDTGLNLSITPTSATSKVYIFATQLVRVGRASNENIAAFKILRGATTVFNTDTGSSTGGYTGFGGGGSGLTTYVGINQVPLQYLDSPATTSSTNYKIQTRLITTANSADLYAQYDAGNSSICLMEIGA